MRRAGAVFGLTLAFCAAAEDRTRSIDLRPIQHRFVELGVGAERLHIQDAAHWQSFWRRFSGTAPPDVDFSRHDVLVVLMGMQASGGYSIGIRAVDAGRRGTRVRLLLCYPPPGSAQVAEVTAPFDARLTPKLAGPVEWQTTEGRTGKPPCT